MVLENGKERSVGEGLDFIPLAIPSIFSFLPVLFLTTYFLVSFYTMFFSSAHTQTRESLIRGSELT
jgi:hypothetical protein